MKLNRQMIIVFTMIMVGTCLIPISKSEETSKIAIFRPFYTPYGKGTIGPWVFAWNTTAVNREINIEGWNVKRLVLCIRWCMHWTNFVLEGRGIGYPPGFTVFFSLDNGETYTHSISFGQKIAVFEREWAGGFLESVLAYYFDFDYDGYFDKELSYLFTPKTRIKIEFPAGFPNVYLAVHYWGAGQKPVPPYDYIDRDGNYVQYSIWFVVEYEETTIEYKGDIVSFNFPETKKRLEKAANMIINTMHPSGASNEVVGKEFGKDSWIVIYSSQLAMMELIDLMRIFPEKNYLLPVKRFIVWMWSKQNLTDGSFPFILTDGDQHPWFNNETNQWYGYDKIDSFSACAISLMRKYYDATKDLNFINQYWNHIFKAKEFIVNLMNYTYWLPVDGYHFNGTHYIKSEMNWLHDCAEAYQGIKDYAYLEGIRGNSSEQNYWNNYAEAIANGIRTHFWNETLKRYAGMFYVNNGTQNTVRVYNIITPVIYGIENNATRAILTVNEYVNWGILSGRYYEVKWAEDYSIYNEYSTMSGMIYSSFYYLIKNFNYTEMWMKEKFLEVTKFLFNNPVYPNRDLQNDEGLLDWVNLVNYTWAKEYARLVETSAWFIDGFSFLPNMSNLYTYTNLELLQINQTLNAQTVFWEQKYQQFKNETGVNWNAGEREFNLWINWIKNQNLYVDWYDYMFIKYLFENGYLGELPWWEQYTFPINWIKHTITYAIWIPVRLSLGLLGLIMLTISPIYTISKIKSRDWSDAFCWGFLMFIIGIALILAWLWS